MKPDALIFDLDGTLWNTVTLVTDSWNRALKELEIPQKPYSESQIQSLMGLTCEEIFNQCFPDMDTVMKAKLNQLSLEYEEADLMKYGGTLYPGVKSGIPKLSVKYPLFLVSNCQENYLNAFLKTSQLQNYFKDWECHGRTGNPKSQNLLSLTKRNHLQSPVYIGDTETDHTSARFAGMPFIYVSYGFGKPHLPPNLSFDSFDSLVDQFLSHK